MEKTKKINWFTNLLFGKWCLIPGYSKHLEFYQLQSQYNQRQEDKFVESEIERLAQEQYQDYLSERQKWDEIKDKVRNPELKKICGPIIFQRSYPRCYHIHDDITAKFKSGGININKRIKERFTELLSNYDYN